MRQSRCFLFFTISKLWNYELIQPADLSTKRLSRATDRNWKCSLRRRKCLTASFSHRRPSEKMVDTSFLFVKDFGWWKHAESNRLGWWVNSPYQLADFLVEFKEKLDVDIHHRSGDDWICHMELAHLYLGQNVQLHIDIGNFTVGVFRTFRLGMNRESTHDRKQQNIKELNEQLKAVDYRPRGRIFTWNHEGFKKGRHWCSETSGLVKIAR